MMDQTLALSTEAQKWVLYVLTGLTVFFVIIRPWLRRRDPLEKKLPSFGLAKQREVEKQMANLLVEMSEMARQITAQIDTRAARLQVLLEEADRKIEQLKRSPSPVASPAAGLLLRQLTDPRPPSSEFDERYAEIYNLSDEGQSASQIAQRIARPSGEVELILALRPKSASQVA